MRVKMLCSRGEGKVEFYTHKNEIKKEYDNGQVVLKLLYKKLQKKYNWKMSYGTFYTYAKLELKNPRIKERKKGRIEEIKTNDSDEETKKEMARVLESLKHLFPDLNPTKKVEKIKKPSSAEEELTPEMEEMLENCKHLFPTNI